MIWKRMSSPKQQSFGVSAVKFAGGSVWIMKFVSGWQGPDLIVPLDCRFSLHCGVALAATGLSIFCNHAEDAFFETQPSIIIFQFRICEEAVQILSLTGKAGRAEQPTPYTWWHWLEPPSQARISELKSQGAPTTEFKPPAFHGFLVPKNPRRIHKLPCSCAMPLAAGSSSQVNLPPLKWHRSPWEPTNDILILWIKGWCVCSFIYMRLPAQVGAGARFFFAFFNRNYVHLLYQNRPFFVKKPCKQLQEALQVCHQLLWLVLQGVWVLNCTKLLWSSPFVSILSQTLQDGRVSIKNKVSNIWNVCWLVEEVGILGSHSWNAWNIDLP